MFQFLVFSIVAISANFAFALTCSSGEYLVLGHHRKGYVRSDGTFVSVEVEYPWVPPTCAHCKEIGHIQRNCLLLPPPTPAPPINPNNPPASAKKPPPAGLPTCYSCNTSGHLMRNCPKGPKGPNDWIKVSHKKKSVLQVSETTLISESTIPSASSDNPPLPKTPLPFYRQRKILTPKWRLTLLLRGN